MRIKIGYFLFICLISIDLYSQNFEWGKSFGASTEDFASDICTDSSGNYYLTGYYDEDVDVDPGPGEAMLYNVDGYDFYLAKYSPEGEFIWVKNFATTGYQDVNDIVIDSDQRILISAKFTETIDVDPGEGEIIITGDASYFTQAFLCLDANGELLWYFTDSDYGAIGATINLDKDENIYLVGSLTNELDMDPGPGVFMLDAASDAFIRKLDHNGNFIWAKKFGDEDIGSIIDIVIDDDDNLFFTGYFSGTLDFDPGPLSYNYTSAGATDVFITKWDAAGNMLWYQPIGGLENEYPKVIEIGEDGNIYTAGRFEGSCDFDGGLGTAIGVAGGYSDAYVCKYSIDGDYIWSWNFGANGIELWNMFEMDSLDNLYVGGNFFGEIDLDPGPGELFTNAGDDYGGYVVKINKDKSLVWATSINTGRGASVVELCLDKNYNILYMGQFSGEPDFDPGPEEYFLPYNGGYPNYWSDVYFAKINQDPCANFTLVTDSIADVSCLLNGYGAVHAINGATPYVYSWNVVPPVTDSVITFTNNGIYTVTASDSNACVRTTTYSIDGPGTLFTDWQTSIVTEDFRYGFESYIWLEAFNNGCEAADGILQLVLDPGFFYIESFPIPDNISGDTLQWELTDFIYGTSPVTPFVVIQNTGAFIGTDVCLDVSILSGAIDINPDNDHWNYCSTVIGAIDPNDKSVYPVGACDAGYILNEQTLTYTVRFQNTGTAPAVNVEIIDSISANLDVQTIDIISTSHYMYTTLDGDSVVHFMFPDIYLPDSIADEPASHGYVVFTIRPKPGLDNYTTIANTAGIYFDYNEPVITNTVLNTIIDVIPSVSTEQNIIMCEGDSVIVGNNIYYTPGTYTDELSTFDGCDSIIYTTISFYVINTEIIADGNTLLSLQEDATYQWIDCNAGNAPIAGATSIMFEPGISGNYAVIVYHNGCVDTSTCLAFTFNPVADNDLIQHVQIAPIPATNLLNIQSASAILNYSIISLDGTLMMSAEGNYSNEQHITISNLAPSMYIISIQTNQGVALVPFIKQ